MSFVEQKRGILKNILFFGGGLLYSTFFHKHFFFKK